MFYFTANPNGIFGDDKVVVVDHDMTRIRRKRARGACPKTLSVAGMTSRT